MQTLAIQYSHGLIAASVLISVLAAYAAFSLADRMRMSATPGRRALWLAGGSTAMGLGIWSMHYLGMLAVRLPMEVYYHVPTVVLSLLLAMAASAVTLTVVSADKLGWGQLLAGGVLMGSGIGAMHYVGMAAMRMDAMHHYSVPLVGLSVLVAVSASVMALWIGFAVRRKASSERMRILAGTVMGLGIAAMHYTAMAAVTFMPDRMRFSTVHTVRVSFLVEAAVICVSAVILLTAVLTAAIEKNRFLTLRAAHMKLAAAQQELLETQAMLREANAMLSELSIRDGMTGLFNRRHFDSALDTEWKRARRGKTLVALLMIDADCFKAMNDHFGHQRGDDCLREIARVLESQPRRGQDVSARFGGEEFAVLLPGATPRGAMKIAEEVRLAVKELGIKNPGSAAGVLTVSVGVACRQPLGDEPASLLVGEADSALYAAKHQGRDRVETSRQVSVEV